MIIYLILLFHFNIPRVLLPLSLYPLQSPPQILFPTQVYTHLSNSVLLLWIIIIIVPRTWRTLIVLVMLILTIWGWFWAVSSVSACSRLCYPRLSRLFAWVITYKCFEGNSQCFHELEWHESLFLTGQPSSFWPACLSSPWRRSRPSINWSWAQRTTWVARYMYLVVILAWTGETGNHSNGTTWCILRMSINSDV